MSIVAGCLQETIYVNIPIRLTIILDEKPEMKYERVGNYFFAHDGPLLSSFSYVPGSTEGFAGARINLPLTDGTTWEPEPGSMWSSGQDHCADHFQLGPFISASYRLEAEQEHYVGFATYFAITGWEWIFAQCEKAPYLYWPETLMDERPESFKGDAIQEDIAKR